MTITTGPPIVLPWRMKKPAPGDGPAIYTSLLDEEIAFLAGLAFGKDVCEIGTAFGYSAVAMKLGGARSVTTCDPHVWLNSFDVAVENVAGWHAEVELLRGRAEERLADRIHNFDLVFVDGDHSPRGVLTSMETADAVCRPGGWLAVHDYGEATCPGVAHVLDQLHPDGPDVRVGTLYVLRKTWKP